MSYKLKLIPKPAYLHAIVAGLNKEETVKSYLQDILKECKIRNYRQVLIEERLKGPRLNTLEIFRIVSEGSTLSRGAFKAIAYVDLNAEGNLMKFAENVAVNRSLPVKVFSSVSDAEKWLLDKAAR